MEIPFSYAFIVIAVVVVIMVAKTATVVPQQSAYVIEYLGKYSRTLQAGFHILIPFVERMPTGTASRKSRIDIAEQICITRDNVQVGVDAVLYMQVLDPHLASYGITNYGFAISQLAQTTLRSEIGKIELDRTFEARGIINANVVSELDKASARLGRQGAALRDQEHHPAEGRAVGDGEADARRAREARRGAHLGRRARRQDQRGRGRQAARHQALRGQQAAADQRGRGPGAGDSRGGHRDRRGPAAGRASRYQTAAASRPCSCASARNT